MSEEPKKLTPKQELFCQEYLVDLNATQAAIRAGYSASTAKEIGCENLTKPHISERIQEALAGRLEKARNPGQMVVDELTAIISTNVFDFFKIGPDGCPYADLRKVPYEMGRVIQEIHTDKVWRTEVDEEAEDGSTKRVQVNMVKIKFWSKTAATEQLGKYYELFTMKHKHDHKHSGEIEHKHTDWGEKSDDEVVEALNGRIKGLPRG